MCIPTLVLASMIGGLAPTDAISVHSLLGEMTNLEVLTEFPEPAYKTIQFSSYDRRSVAPYAPDWYGNSDGFGGEPIPNVMATLKEPDADGVGVYLLAEVKGPGAVVRTWSAVINGDLTVTLDGRAKPLYQGDASRFLQRTYSVLARQAGVIDADEGSGFRQEDACYFPIPFARSLRIEWRGRLDQLHFYHIETRLYPRGTGVETFQLSDLVDAKEDIKKVLARLRYPGAQIEPPAHTHSVPLGKDVDPGARVLLAEATGPAALYELTLNVTGDDPVRALRQTVLRIHFDGAAQPQVESPIGDFFGSGPGISPFDSLPMTVSADGSMVCRFIMPFAQSARLTVDNLGSSAVRVEGHIALGQREWVPGKSMHFFAKWRVDHGLIAGGGDASFDIPYLCARGRGVFVGVAAMLLNPTNVPTSGGNWWGEGDEKIWVDDDAFPSLFGTGSEDYFNYAWSRPTLFSHAYCAQPLNTGPGNRGFVTNSRWHVLDALPFKTHIEFYMELMHHSRTPEFTYARLACFYAGPELRDDHVPITPSDVSQGLELPANWLPEAAGAAQGAIFYQAQDMVAAGTAGVTILEGRTWSAGKLLAWTPSAPGNTLTLKLNVAKAGRYRLAITGAHTPTSGRFTAAVDDGKDMAPTIDLYTPHQHMLRTVFLQTGGGPELNLSVGDHALTLTSRGKGTASAGTDIGIDFIWLLPGR